MQKEKSSKTNTKKSPDLNGNNAQVTRNGIKDQIVTSDGRIFYPCQYCNKVFPIKKSRTFHIKKCPAKDYILSVDERNIPKKAANKIDIQQNIVLSEQMDVSEILKSNSPPIKITIRRNGAHDSDEFTVSNSLVLKEKNEAIEDFNALAKRLQSNAVTLIKQPKKEDEEKPKSEGDSSSSESIKEDSDESNETTCRECTKEFGSPLELLRHSRKCHSYPKVVMALSEVKKFYSVKNRSECPICHKPLKTSFRSAFVKHLHTHTNEMKYSCHVCKKKFRRSDHMKAHEKRHIIKDKK
ncbi:hypothetical protein Zmor_017905 [Zophobas morio]|uniref:C2H2-type domain-containing protein n=1 Tax=Zophobas morio TaxID=2755281 RepID=A0AA38IAL0_9CUCU|nr:hypothetical protein Zmor_017905 [Zophobas morio]